MMRAQAMWKQRYRMFRTAYSSYHARTDNRVYMRIVRREAALERIVARQQREIEAQARQLKELGAAYDRMRDTVMDLTL